MPYTYLANKKVNQEEIERHLNIRSKNSASVNMQYVVSLFTNPGHKRNCKSLPTSARQLVTSTRAPDGEKASNKTVGK